MLQSYSVFVHLLDGNSVMWAQHDGVPLNGLQPTTHWVVGETISDTHELTLPIDVPPGRYRLDVGMYLPETMEHLPVWDAEMQPRGDRIAVHYVRVGESFEEPHTPQRTSAFNLDSKVILRGHDIEVTDPVPGGTVRVVLYWEAVKRMDEDYTVFVHLVDQSGRIWGQKDNQPQGGFYPTSFWEEGEVVRDEYEFSIDPDASPGPYQIEAGMYVLATGQRLPVVDDDGQMIDDKILLSSIDVVG
jgi:hypothetical protein